MNVPLFLEIIITSDEFGNTSGEFALLNITSVRRSPIK